MTDETTVDTETATVNADTVVVNNTPAPGSGVGTVYAAATAPMLDLKLPSTPVDLSQVATTTTKTQVAIPPEVQKAVGDYLAQAGAAAVAAHGAELNNLASSLIDDLEASAATLVQNVVHDKRAIYLVGGLVGSLVLVCLVLLWTILFGSAQQHDRAIEVLKYVGPFALPILGIAFHHYSK